MVARLVGIVVLVPLLAWGFFTLAGRWDWVAGWGCLAVLFAGSAASDVVVWRTNPELLLQRGTIAAGTKTWDIVCLTLFGISYLAILIVGALDGGRYGWSEMPVWLWPVGAGLFTASQAILTWCMVVNRNFEKTARIQTDRGHAVIQSGPYRFIRHPGYAATIVGYNFGTALMLVSWWAIVPAALSGIVLVIRTDLEDRMLRDELPGYRDYTERVRFRLVPGVW